MRSRTKFPAEPCGLASADQCACDRLTMGGGAGQDGWLAVWLLACAYGVWLCFV